MTLRDTSKDSKAQICFEKLIRACCPICRYLFYSKHGEHQALKTVFGFAYGIFLGVIFHQMILVDLDFTSSTAILIGAIFSLILAFGNAVSVQIRCIGILTIPSFCGRAGRGVFKAIILAYILSGPIQNLSNNGREVIRVFACTTSLTYNLTKTRFDLMVKPFKQALFGIKADVSEMKETIRSIRDVSAPIVKEFENEEEMLRMREENDYIDEKLNDTKRSKEIDKKYRINQTDDAGEVYEKNYLKKLETRCEDQLTRGAAKCRAQFGNVYDKCYDTVSWFAAWLLCWPMKLTFVCNIAEAMGGSKPCDPTKTLDPGVGKGYWYLKNAKNTLGQNFKDVKLQYKVENFKPLLDIRSATDTAKGVINAFNEKRSLLDSILVLFKRILAFIFIKVILEAQFYHDQYIRNIQFDNIYITRYFRKIDARRRFREQNTLLPLKKIETLKLIDPWSVVPLRKERKSIVNGTVKLLLEMITATTFVLLDRLFFEVLDLVQRHAEITYEQKGHHDLMLEVKGTGMIASLLRSVLKGFNIKKRIKTVLSNAQCLPRPTKMLSYYLYKIYGAYLIIWVLILLEAYSQRLNHVICGYYYPKRQKKRILHLYNETLKRRRGFFKYMRRKVQNKAREQRLAEDLNVFHVLLIRFPKLFCWLRLFEVARRKCVICQDVEPCSRRKAFRRCGNEFCYVVYCSECWVDIERECLACTLYNDLESSGLESSDSESDVG